MYNTFFGVQKNPFNMTPDPAFLYFTPQHREALAGLVYAILEKRGFVVLTGEAGTGKTTLLSKTLESIPSDSLRTSLILNPTVTGSEFLEMVLLDFGIRNIPPSKALRLAMLHGFLLEGQSAGKVTALIIDEAQKLSPEVLEEIRLLGNFECADQKLLQIILIGQSELGDVLNREDMRQFKQRIALRISIHPLGEVEVGEYIAHRWKKAGGIPPGPFTQEAINAISRFSRGIPRLINSICDNSLMLAFAESVQTVTTKHVMNVAADLDLKERSQPAIAAAEPTPTVGPAVAPMLAPPLTLRTLERYGPEPHRKSLLQRWAGRLGLTQTTGEV